MTNPMTRKDRFKKCYFSLNCDKKKQSTPFNTNNNTIKSNETKKISYR